MIDIAAGAIEFDGITVFPDDEDTRRWYFVSARPRITTNADGTAAFQLMKYRRVPASGDAGGGGLLDLGVDLGVPPESLERAKAGLRASHPGADITLVPVPADRITCEVRLDAGDLDESHPGPEAASVDPPHVVSAHASLSMPATLLLESAVNAGAAAGSVTYRLAVTARRPAVPAALTIDWTRTASFFAAQSSAPPSPAQLEAGVARLVEQGSVRIETQGDTLEAPASAVLERATREAVMLIAARLSSGASSDGVGAYDLSQPRTATETLTVADTLGRMLAAIPAANRPPVMLVEEEPWSFDVSVHGVFQHGDGVRLIEVTIASGGTSVDLLLDPERPSGTARFAKTPGRAPIEYSYRVLLGMDAPMETTRTRFDAPARTVDLRTIVIDPRDVMNVLRVNAVAMFPFDLYRAAFVDVNVGVAAEHWSTSRTLRLDDAARDASFAIAFARGSTAVMQHRIRHVTRAGAVIEGAWQATDPVAIVVGLPADAAAAVSLDR